MAIRKFISITRLVGDIYRLYRDDISLNELDIIEWADDALRLIGTKAQLCEMVVELPVSNHHAMLPCGFVREIQLADNCGAAMLPNTATMFPRGHGSKSDDYFEGQPLNNMRFPQMGGSPNSSTSSYYIQNGCIYTSYAEGTVTLAFVGANVDEEGYPLIPDVEEFEQAVKWFVLSQIFTKKWLAGTEAMLQKMQHAENKWKEYKRKAVDQSIMPTLPEMENLKNIWVRLVPRQNEFKNFFATLAEPEHKKTFH
jgi:hypothetical protein